MANLKNDLHEIGNPSLTVGVADYGATRASRPFIVENMGGTNRENQLVAGQTFIESHVDKGDDGLPVHPDLDVPLHSVHVVPFATHAIGVGRYMRSRTSNPRYPAFEYASESSYDAGRRVERFFPDELYEWSRDQNGLGKAWALEYRWIKREFRRHQIIVQTKIRNHPLAEVEKTRPGGFGGWYGYPADTPVGKPDSEPLLLPYGHINSEPFKINGVERAPGTLRFEDAAVVPVDTYAGKQWLVRYEFTYDPRTFYNRYLIWNWAKCSDLTPQPSTAEGCATTSTRVGIFREQLITGPTTIVVSPEGSVTTITYTITPDYDLTDFNGVFPTHDSPSGWDGNRSTGGGFVPPWWYPNG